jgi:hypothetical protein
MAESLIHFKPWIGSGYGSETRGGLRLLVLGESHYAGPEDDADSLTNDVVRAHLAGRQRLRFFTAWSTMLAGKEPFAQMKPDEVIESVVFSNFVQQLAGSQHDSRPSATMWDAAVAPFCALLDEYRPDAVLVLGVATWDAIRFEHDRASRMESDQGEHRTWTRPDGHEVVATWIPHPSGSHGFSRRDWDVRITHFLGRAVSACKNRRSGSATQP